MFTGIIESVGSVEQVSQSGSNHTFWIQSPISSQLTVDQSVSHNGVCLTVEEVSGQRHRVTAIDETIQKTHLGNWRPGTPVNLERCMSMQRLLDGHIVQGHVDSTALCLQITDHDGSTSFRFSFDERFSALVIEKGSVCINGISLTAFDVSSHEFSVAIIPYTMQHTNMGQMSRGDRANLEFDVIGKYVQRFLDLK